MDLTISEIEGDAVHDVGDIDVHYALLEGVKEDIPETPARPAAVIPTGDDSMSLEIGSPLSRVYMKLIDVEGKRDWVVGLDGLERRELTARIDERHTCYFQGMRFDFNLLHAELTKDRAQYLEAAEFTGTPFKHEQLYTLERIDEQRTAITLEIKWQEDPAPPDEMKQMYLGGCAASFDVLRSQCEAA